MNAKVCIPIMSSIDVLPTLLRPVVSNVGYHIKSQASEFDPDNYKLFVDTIGAEQLIDPQEYSESPRPDWF